MTNVFIVSAPSGSGKSTLVKGLLATVPRLRFSISYTTRPPRGEEVHGCQYYFISRDEFEAMIARGEFLEHAEVFGNYYGTHRSELDFAERDGQDLVLDIDVKGARQLRVTIPQAVSIFVLAPSREELVLRLRARGDTAEEVIQKRLREAVVEIADYRQYDYVLVNRKVPESIETLCSIIRAERIRRIRVEEEVQQILATFEGSEVSK